MTAIMEHEQELKDAWLGSVDSGADIALRQFIGLRLGLARNTPETLGVWLPTSKRLSYDWRTKRQPVLRRVFLPSDIAARTVPYDGGPALWSIPYDRSIGGLAQREADRLDWADTPDWAQTLTENL